MKKIVRVGPWGGLDGEHWSFKATGKISRIIIYHGVCINSIRFTSKDDDGNELNSLEAGDPRGARLELVDIDIDVDVDELNCISGTIGCCDSKMVVTSLSFSTDFSKFGPFSKAQGTHFLLPIARASFAGFFGRSGDCLHSIGAYLTHTHNCLHFGVWDLYSSNQEAFKQSSFVLLGH